MGGGFKTLPSWDKQSGGAGLPETDFVFMVRADEEARCSVAAAWAGPILFDQFQRPILGMINFCPSIIGSLAATYATYQGWGASDPSWSDERAWQMSYGGSIITAAHEIAHALGVNSGTFTQMRNFDGKTPRTAESRPELKSKSAGDFGTKVLPASVEGVKCADGRTANEQESRIPSEEVMWRGELPDTERRSPTAPISFKIVTPTVQAAIRDQFGCDTVNGVQLEADDSGARSCIGK